MSNGGKITMARKSEDWKPDGRHSGASYGDCQVVVETMTEQFGHGSRKGNAEGQGPPGRPREQGGVEDGEDENTGRHGQGKEHRGPDDRFLSIELQLSPTLSDETGSWIAKSQRQE